MILAWLYIVFQNLNVLSSSYWVPNLHAKLWVSQITSSWVHVGLHLYTDHFSSFYLNSVSQKFPTPPASWFTWTLITTYIVVAISRIFIAISKKSHQQNLQWYPDPGFSNWFIFINLSIIASLNHHIGFTQEASNSLVKAISTHKNFSQANQIR